MFCVALAMDMDKHETPCKDASFSTDLHWRCSLMKKDIHPKYDDCNVSCSCGNSFKTRSTQ